MSSSEILALSYDRPLQLLVTHLSIRLSLGRKYKVTPIRVFDQNSTRCTRLVLRFLHRNSRVQITWSNENIGMLSAWKELVLKSDCDYLLLLENDWFCDATNSSWFEDACTILDSDPELSLVKLRKLMDVDDYGRGLMEHQPWTVVGEKVDNNYRVQSARSGNEFFVVSSSFTSFTFNPVLIRREFLVKLLTGAQDDPEDPTPLRSGENVLDERWRGNPRNFAAVLNGPFGHIGFHNRRNYIWPMMAYLLRMISRIYRLAASVKSK